MIIDLSSSLDGPAHKRKTFINFYSYAAKFSKKFLKLRTCIQQLHCFFLKLCTKNGAFFFGCLKKRGRMQLHVSLSISAKRTSLTAPGFCSKELGCSQSGITSHPILRRTKVMFAKRRKSWHAKNVISTACKSCLFFGACFLERRYCLLQPLAIDESSG